MTNPNESDAEARTAIRAIEEWENTAAKGLARCAPKIFDEQINYIQGLRERQKDYLASLPKDPEQAISEASKVLEEIFDDHPNSIRETLMLAQVLEELFANRCHPDNLFERDPAAVVIEQLVEVLKTYVAAIGRINDLLRNSRRKG
ncbi:hypothetical protein [Pseudaestuariivita rosea]|uniref:hypothetical protein n=1 Tax=Pseudaestuariivita rosea TaxID=2763263 RepID=UPI001ABA78B3|nr:hypothetical protein [Pseudaestuariivita rosea]